MLPLLCTFILPTTHNFLSLFPTRKTLSREGANEETHDTQSNNLRPQGWSRKSEEARRLINNENENKCRQEGRTKESEGKKKERELMSPVFLKYERTPNTDKQRQM